MTFRTLIFRSLRFHWRAHLGVLLGAVVGSAALIGALIVGDSVRGSLQEMAAQRLGWVDVALVTPDRVFTKDLQNVLKPSGYGSFWSPLPSHAESVLALQATAARQDGSARANSINLLGIDRDLFETNAIPPWSMPYWLTNEYASILPTNIPASEKISVIRALVKSVMPSNSVVLNEALAAQLHAQPGDEIILRLPKLNSLSREVPIAPQSDSTVALRLKVHAIATATEMGNFSLQPSQVPPLNAFIQVEELEGAATLEGKRNILLAGPESVTAMRPIYNSLNKLPNWIRAQIPKKLWDYAGTPQHVFASSEQHAAKLNKGFPINLEDTGWALKAIPAMGVVELHSSRIFLDPIVTTITQNPTNLFPGKVFYISGPMGNPIEHDQFTNCFPILSYFVNQFRAGTNTTPYSMVTAAGKPWTPPDMKDEEIIVNQWLAEDLNIKSGDTVDLTYFLPESAADLIEATNRFRVRAIVPLEGIYADRTLMPEFPGIAKAESTHNWDAGFPLVHTIRDKDEEYWKKYRGTPKAFVTLAAGQKMWGNRFGNLTAIRWTIPPRTTPGVFRAGLELTLRQNLKPADFGLTFQPVRSLAMKAANQAQDFGQLFLGFSFFVIIAALILMALLFQFGLEQRITEVGTLLALGFTPKQVRRLFLGEAAALAFLGGIIGVLGGAGYAWAMLQGLAGIWRGAVNTSALSFHASASTICIGLIASTIVSTLSIALVMRKAAKRPARELLAEGAEAAKFPIRKHAESGTVCRLEVGDTAGWKPALRSPSALVGIVALVLAVALVIYAITSSQTAPGLFFGAGALLLISGLCFSAVFLARLGKAASAQSLSIASLGIRSCTRRRKRSLATIALLACGSFIIVAVGANRLEAGRDAQKRSSGTGGFALMGDSTLPVVHDLNTARGRDFFGLDDKTMSGVQVVPMRVHAGDDASCLNLNRAQKPRLLGVNPGALAERKAFTFASVMEGLSANKAWNLLNGPVWRMALSTPENPLIVVPEIPAIGDANSIQWAMGKKVGNLIDYVDEHGQPFKVRIVGSVANSVLQGALLISEENFRTLFPSETGYRMFLIDAPANQTQAVSAALTRALQDVGLELMPATQRLDEFNAVQNTYLTTFQILGGLGLLLGSAGLGLVVLRNVLERRGELGLLQAIGLRRRALQRLLLSEHGGLLLIGLGIGIFAALVAILPVLLSPGGEIHYVSLALTLITVLINGFVWTWLATRWALRGELLAALRNE